MQLSGYWWSLNSGSFGKTLFTLEWYIKKNSNAVIINSANEIGGLRIVAGSYGDGWARFNGNVDNVSIGVNGKEIVYDFEAQSNSKAKGKVAKENKASNEQISR